MRQDGQQETGRTARDRTDSKRQDRQQGTGQTARDRTGIERKIEQDAEQDNTVMAGEGGLLSKIETGNANRSDGTGQEGQNRKSRKYRKAKK